MRGSFFRSKRPYKSSNIYNVTASLTDNFEFLSMTERLEEARKILFNFDYPTPENIDSETFKEYFETMFISKFFNSYFKVDTFEQFQFRLLSKMLEIMPTYNAMLSYFFYNDKEKLMLSTSKTVSNSKDIGSDTHRRNFNSSESSTDTNKGTDKNINSVFPSNLINSGNRVGDVRNANNGALNNSESENNRKSTHTDNENSSNEHTNNNNFTSETISGNMLESVLKFNKEYSNIFKKLLKEFNPLFSANIEYCF